MRTCVAAILAASIAASSSLAVADTPTASVAEPPPSKKETYLESKRDAEEIDQNTSARARERWHRHLGHLVGRAPERIINIYNGWTHETLPVTAGRPAGKGDPVPKELIDRFFRCRWTNRATDMDPALFPTLVAAADHFGVDRVFVISGFRSAKFNLMLQKKGHQVGRESKHVLGKAVDFRLPGVSTHQLRKWAKSLVLGGVGFYPKSHMIHVDTARVRYWEGD